MDGVDAGVAHVKLAWWLEEIERAGAGHPLHPITQYLLRLPHADARALMPLKTTVAAAAAHFDGAPVEAAADLPAHAIALVGTPMAVAARFSGAAESTTLEACIAALAAGDYLLRAVAGYRREARGGRLAFAVEELLAAGIENEDLMADTAPARLTQYLGTVRARAAHHFADAAGALAADERPPLRHLAVLARLGETRANEGRDRAGADFRWRDLYNAWTAARRAVRRL